MERKWNFPARFRSGLQTPFFMRKTEFHLDPGSRLTFYSDGVIEAQQPGGELFGFDRGAGSFNAVCRGDCGDCKAVRARATTSRSSPSPEPPQSPPLLSPEIYIDGSRLFSLPQ